MKKLSLFFAFLLAVLVVNAQTTRVPVKTADLPKAIAADVTKTHAGYTIKDATKVTENKVVTFDVVIAKGTATETLCYDKDGKFLMKMEPKTTTPAAAPAQKPAEKTTPAKK
jgi:hypothetical protein